MLLATFLLIFVGCQRLSAEVIAAPACNGTAQEASPCIEKKILGWRADLNMPGSDATYQVFEAACKADDPDGCWMLGQALRGDSFVSDEMHQNDSFRQDLIDPERSAMMIEKSCDLGSEYGCLNHAANRAVEAHWNPEELQKSDLKKVMNDFYRSCELGFVSGCGGYFDLSVSMQPAPDIDKEKYAAKALCDNKIGSGCHLLGVYIMREAQGEDQHKLALPLWKQGCEYGYEDACRAYAGNMDYLGNDEEHQWAIRTACGFGFHAGEWGTVDSVDYAPCSSLESGSKD
jgi:TPR repeat protein